MPSAFPKLHRDSLELSQATKNRLVFVEKAHLLGGLFFLGVSSFITAALVRNMLSASPQFEKEISLALVLPIGIGIGALGLAAMVTSTFTADRTTTQLQIRRQIGAFEVTRSYPFGDIEGFFQRRTLKGNQLKVRFRSGRIKCLTLWAEYRVLDHQESMLNHFVKTASVIDQ